HTLHGRRVFLAAAPGLEALADVVGRGLLDAGADTIVERSGDDDSSLAETANRYQAALFVALRPGDSHGCHCSYFESGRFRSETGYRVARSLYEELSRALGCGGGVCGRAYAVLRETRMAAVICEPVQLDDVVGMRRLVVSAGAIGRAVPVRLGRACLRRPHRFFDRPHRQVLVDDAPGELLLEGAVRGREQSPRVSHAELALVEGALDRRRELEEPERVRDRRPAAAHPGRDVVVGE